MFKFSRIICVGMCYVISIAIFSTLCSAVVRYQRQGMWPESWPKELEPFRKRASTYGVAHGTQETVYEIPFKNRREFEKVWPTILQLKSRCAPIRLFSCHDRSTRSSSAGLENKGPMVRVIAPAFGSGALRPLGVASGDELEWPESVKLQKGELPEYVDTAEDGTWLPEEKVANRGLFKHRARIDIELVVDGTVIDLNRIRLPANTPIIDERRPPGMLQSLQTLTTESVVIILAITVVMIAGCSVLKLVRKRKPSLSR